MLLDVPRSARPGERPLAFIPPCLPKLTAEPPAGDGWLHEIKHDGNRTLVAVESGRARAWTRNGFDWTERYARVVDCAAALRCRSAILDGEMVVQDARGVSDFNALRRAMAREPHRLVFFAFDLIHLDGADLRARPLVERRALLEALLGPNDPACPIQFSAAVAGDGAAIFAAAERMGLEGIVSKKAGSRYHSGGTTAWLKTKCMTVGDFVVLGTERQPGAPAFALLARDDEDGLHYAGSAFVTLGQPARDLFWTRAGELAADKPVLRDLRRPKTAWCRPGMRVRVRHLKGGDLIRHGAVVAVL